MVTLAQTLGGVSIWASVAQKTGLAAPGAGPAPGKPPLAVIFFWLAVLLVAIVVMVLLVHFLRLWYFGPEDDTTSLGNFSLGELREMRDDGRLSEEEYDRAKKLIVAKGRAKWNAGAADTESPTADGAGRKDPKAPRAPDSRGADDKGSDKGLDSEKT